MLPSSLLPLNWYKKAARLEADREVVLPAKAYRKGKGIILNQYGLASFFALCVMALFCVNYSSNAGLICACLLGLTWTLAVLANHWVISRITLLHVSVLPGDEEDPGEVEMLWHINSFVRPVFWLTVDGQVARVVFDQSGQARVRWKPLPRPMGRYVFPTIRMSTSWPMSIGFSWFILRPAHDVVLAPSGDKAQGASGLSGQASSNSLANSGEPEGVRPRNESDRAARWAWKQTLRQNRPMTFEWSQQGNDVVRIVFSEELDPVPALHKLRSELNSVVQNRQSFQIIHPWGQTPVLSGDKPALAQVCWLSTRVLPRTAWGAGVPVQSHGLFHWLRNLFGRSRE